MPAYCNHLSFPLKYLSFLPIVSLTYASQECLSFKVSLLSQGHKMTSLTHVYILTIAVFSKLIH